MFIGVVLDNGCIKLGVSCALYMPFALGPWHTVIITVKSQGSRQYWPCYKKTGLCGWCQVRLKPVFSVTETN